MNFLSCLEKYEDRIEIGTERKKENLKMYMHDQIFQLRSIARAHFHLYCAELKVILIFFKVHLNLVG